MIIPSIDIMNGKAVQLKQGKEKVLERIDVMGLAKEFSLYGEIAVIDLDAAFDKGNNRQLIKEICSIADCRVGGGIRTKEIADELLQAGAKKIIIGTNATPEFLKQFPKDRLIVAIDTKDGFVVNRGWTQVTGKTPEEYIRELENYCSGFLFTNVNKEGMMSGCDLDKIKELRKITKNSITVAGGISTIEEIKIIENQGMDSQIGMALYTEKINLSSAFISLLDFNKNTGLIPTIVQDENNCVLMLAYSTKESLEATLKTKEGTYYSRKRKRLWTKGESSGNTQKIIKIKYDCDRDTFLFIVKQKGVACHTGKYSCFGEKEFGFNDLYEVLIDRLTNEKTGSYTSKILKNENAIKKKIIEEAGEVVNYKNKENLVWEIADLMYFTMALMVNKGITPEEVKNELWRRRK